MLSMITELLYLGDIYDYEKDRWDYHRRDKRGKRIRLQHYKKLPFRHKVLHSLPWHDNERLDKGSRQWRRERCKMEKQQTQKKVNGLQTTPTGNTLTLNSKVKHEKSCQHLQVLWDSRAAIAICKHQPSKDESSIDL